MPNILAPNCLDAELNADTYTGIIPVTQPLSDELVAEVLRERVAVELRVDHMHNAGVDVYAHASRFAGAAILGTIRDAGEGGEWQGEPSDKCDLFEEVVDYVDGIDVELAFPGLNDVVRIADGKVVIVSSHYFATHKPLTFGQMEYRYRQAMRAGADYFKIAAMANTQEALDHLYTFMQRQQGEPVIAVAMGNRGVEGRKRLLELGSRATFAYGGSMPVVPGQLSLAEFVQFRDGHGQV